MQDLYETVRDNAHCRSSMSRFRRHECPRSTLCRRTCHRRDPGLSLCSWQRAFDQSLDLSGLDMAIQTAWCGSPLRMEATNRFLETAPAAGSSPSVIFKAVPSPATFDVIDSVMTLPPIAPQTA